MEDSSNGQDQLKGVTTKTHQSLKLIKRRQISRVLIERSYTGARTYTSQTKPSEPCLLSAKQSPVPGELKGSIASADEIVLLIYVLKSASSLISAREDWSMNKRQESIWEERVKNQISFSCLGLWIFYIKEKIGPSVSSTSTDPPGSRSSCT